MAPIVGYWDIRGYGEPIRLMLHHAGVDFEDKRYVFGPPPEISLDDWMKEKLTLGLEFPNLPYYIDGDIKITQSIAIVRYIAKKHGLVPKTEQGVIRADTFEQISRDIMLDLVRHAYYPPQDNPVIAEWGKKKTEDAVKGVSDSLGDKNWLVDDELSYADFLIVEALDQLSYLYPRILKDHPNIAGLIKRLESLPNVEKYIEGAKYRVWPFYSPYARWSGAGEAPPRN